MTIFQREKNVKFGENNGKQEDILKKLNILNKKNKIK